MLKTLQPAAFQAVFTAWLHAMRSEALATTGIEQPIFAIDGKTQRRSHDRAHGLGPRHCMSLWAGEYGLTLGQLACGEKSNEITAIPELLRLVVIQRAILTIDAMGTQTAIALEIIAGGGDYVLAVKANQPTLQETVVRLIDDHLEGDLAVEQELVTRETGHGRQESRTDLQLPVPEGLAESGLWKGLKSIGMATTSQVRNGQEKVEARDVISSLGVDGGRFARAVRGHWSIENSGHWNLDMTFGEDQSRVRERHLSENFGWLNRFALSLLKPHPGRQSVTMQRRSCGWSERFLLEVVTASTC